MMNRRLNRTMMRTLFFVLVMLLSFATVAFAASAKVGTIKLRQSAKTVSSVTLSWKVQGQANRFEVQQYDKTNKKYVLLATTSKTEYTVKKLAPGEDYVVTVRPLLTSNSATEQGKAAKLRVYTAIKAVSSIKQEDTTSSSHVLKWSKVKGAEKYAVYYYNTSSKSFSLLGETKNNYVRMSNLKPATVYKYRVRAVSVASDQKQVNGKTSKTLSAYTVPADVKNLRLSDVTTEGFRLQWDASAGANGYIIYKFDETTGQYAELTKAAATSYVVRGLAPGTSQYYQVCAYATLLGENRLGAITKPFAATTKPKTVTPKFVSGDPARKKVKIKWTPNENCDGYRIFVTETEGKNLVMAQEVPLGTTKTVVVKLPNKCDKVYIYMQTYLNTDSGRVFSDYSSPLNVISLPETTA